MAAFPDTDQTQTQISESDTTYNVTSCLVCTEFYTDPRILNCGHHFCLSCLQKIAESDTNGHVTCPSCRHVTDESPETLSKLRMNEFQVKAAEYVATTFPTCERACEFCGTLSLEMLSCFECRINFCGQCKENHQSIEEIESHKVFPTTCHQFCDVHPDKFIQWKCKDCEQMSCISCLKDHKNHTIQSIKELSKNVTERLTNDVLAVVNVDTDENVLKSIEHCIRNLKDWQDEFKDLNREIKQQVKSFLEKIEKEEQKTLETIDGDIKKLEVLQWEAKQFIMTKQDLLIYIRKLISESSDSELLARESSFPKYATSEFIDTIGFPTMQEPVFEKLHNINRYLKKIIEADFGHCVKKPVHFKNLKDLKAISDITVNEIIGNAIHYISSLDVLAVYKHTGKIVMLYDTYGGEKQQIQVKSDIERDKLQSLEYDPVRELFLLPSLTGDIITISLTGEEGKIAVIDKPLYGISYSEEDLYVTSSAGGNYGGTDSVYIVNPNTGDLVSTFKPTCTFITPLNVLCGYKIAMGVKIPVIYVCEHSGNQIKEIDFSGETLNEMKLTSNPYGMALDAEGNVILCLYGAKSVVSCTMSNDGKNESLKVLISLDLQDGRPEGLVCDIKRGRIFVSVLGKFLKCFG